jgi:hypothetical protein
MMRFSWMRLAIVRWRAAQVGEANMGFAQDGHGQATGMHARFTLGSMVEKDATSGLFSDMAGMFNFGRDLALSCSNAVQAQAETTSAESLHRHTFRSFCPSGTYIAPTRLHMSMLACGGRMPAEAIASSASCVAM